MKQAYKLTPEELASLNRLRETGDQPGFTNLWAHIGNKMGFNPETIEGSASSDPSVFMADPALPKIAVDEKVRGEWTSASNAQADSLCPGRHIAQAGIPDSESEDAAMGKRIHAALANVPSALDKLTLEERETFDACREIEKKLCDQFFGDPSPKMMVFREERRWARLKPKDTVIAHSGQADVVFRAGTKALVIDYKVLRGDVEDSPANMQLRDLAVLTWRNVELLSEIGTAIVQPLVTHSPEICLYTTADLARAETEMFERVVKSNDPASPRVPGVAQCKFCKAKSKCVEYNRWIGSQLPVVVEPIVQAAVFQVAMDKWTPQDRAVVAGMLPVLVKRLDEIKDWLKDGLAQDAGFVPGFKLKEGSTRERITNPQTLFDRFAAVGGTLEKFFPCLDVLKGEFKKAVNEVTGAKGRALNSAMTALLDGITVSSKGAPTLVKDKNEH